MSIRVSTAVALKQGSAWPHDFTAWDDRDVRRLRNLMDVQVDDEIESRYPQLNGCRLQITLASGEQRQAYLPNMKGEPEFRMSEGEIREKFAVLTRNLFDGTRADRIFANCSELENVDDISQLTQLCAAAEPIVA